MLSIKPKLLLLKKVALVQLLSLLLKRCAMLPMLEIVEQCYHGNIMKLIILNSEEGK